jgi:serine/threonine protein kinase
MPPAPTAESGTYRPFTKLVGSEPLPGYKLLEPLGRGGFGEVWKCEAPGGLLKAVKFVSGEETGDGRGEQRLHQELGAFQEIKSIRHPFLLTLERVEIVGGELVMVMELADRQLQDRFRECKAFGLPGIPRDELLAYFADAAEALDMIAAKYELQHLDVKPANLFLVAGHVKVGDYGLVARLHPDASQSDHRGLTPKYVAPEVLRGQPCSRSDQYSLALVYQELLTGTFPYEGKSPQQLMMHHIATKPDLSGLPPADRAIVRRALAKKPEERYGSCLAFVQALMMVPNAASTPSAGMEVRRARVERSIADMNMPVGEPLEADDDSGASTGAQPRGEVTQNVTLPVGPRPGAPTTTAPALPPAAARPAAPPRTPPPTPPAVVNTPGPNIPQVRSGALPQLVAARRSAPQPPAQRPVSLELDPARPADSRFAVTLTKIRTVLPVSRLLGKGGDDTIAAPEYARALVDFAAPGAFLPQAAGDTGRAGDGSWFCQFPSTVSPQVVPLKLIVLHETWGVSVDQPEPTRLVLRKTHGGGFFSGRKGGIEVVVSLPQSGGLGEVTVTGTLFGSPPADLARQAPDLIPRMLAEIRSQLGNVEDRRKHPRVAADFAATLYPIHSAGGIDEPLHGRVRDVSQGGLCVVTDAPLPTKYAYCAFDDVEAVAGFAILTRFLRSHVVGRECVLGGQYRVNL